MKGLRLIETMITVIINIENMLLDLSIPSRKFIIEQLKGNDIF